jgi:hypothetical protein
MGRLTFESMNLSGIPPYCEVEAALLGRPALGMRVFRGCWHVENQRLSHRTGFQGRDTGIHRDPIPGHHAGAVDGMGG